jgi:hypothetical protein
MPRRGAADLVDGILRATVVGRPPFSVEGASSAMNHSLRNGFFGRDVLRKLRVGEANVDLAFRRDEQGRTDFVINEVTGVLDVMRVD